LGHLSDTAVTESSEVVIEATHDEIMDVSRIFGAALR
jgi:hypothetical protein